MPHPILSAFVALTMSASETVGQNEAAWHEGLFHDGVESMVDELIMQPLQSVHTADSSTARRLTEERKLHASAEKMKQYINAVIDHNDLGLGFGKKARQFAEKAQWPEAQTAAESSVASFEDALRQISKAKAIIAALPEPTRSKQSTFFDGVEQKIRKTKDCVRQLQQNLQQNVQQNVMVHAPGPVPPCLQSSRPHLNSMPSPTPVPVTSSIRPQLNPTPSPTSVPIQPEGSAAPVQPGGSTATSPGVLVAAPVQAQRLFDATTKNEEISTAKTALSAWKVAGLVVLLTAGLGIAKRTSRCGITGSLRSEHLTGAVLDAAD